MAFTALLESEVTCSPGRGGAVRRRSSAKTSGADWVFLHLRTPSRRGIPRSACRRGCSCPARNGGARRDPGGQHTGRPCQSSPTKWRWNGITRRGPALLASGGGVGLQGYTSAFFRREVGSDEEDHA